jgi:hypothetical protein
MGSTFFSVWALHYVIFPIEVLAKSCKPVPIMLMEALMGKKYPLKKYLKVGLIVEGVGLCEWYNLKNDRDRHKHANVYIATPSFANASSTSCISNYHSFPLWGKHHDPSHTIPLLFCC